jgi:hypothetical protein
MPTISTSVDRVDSVGQLLRVDENTLQGWLMNRRTRLMWICVVAIAAGGGVYGATMGSWRCGLQALFTGIKLPLVILLTTLSNGLLNGMLAPLLGLNVTFRQSLAMVLVSFAVASLILGALSPVSLFLVWNTPPLTAATRAVSPEYGFLQLMLAAFIALAGVIGNARLLPLLKLWSGRAAVARRVLFAWLICNLFLGSQICWVLRPFIWDPRRPVEFVGPEPLHGNFYETVFEALRRLLF